MSKKRNAELRERSLGDLTQLNGELERELWKTRFGNYTNQLDDTAKIRRTRRDIARVKTILTQKQAAEQGGGVIKRAVVKAAHAVEKAAAALKPAKTAKAKKAKG